MICISAGHYSYGKIDKVDSDDVVDEQQSVAAIQRGFSEGRTCRRLGWRWTLSGIRLVNELSVWANETRMALGCCCCLGIPTFRGAGGLWRTYVSSRLICILSECPKILIGLYI